MYMTDNTDIRTATVAHSEATAIADLLNAEHSADNGLNAGTYIHISGY